MRRMRPEAELLVFQIVNHDGGDQIAADNKKYVDANKATSELLNSCMKQNH